MSSEQETIMLVYLDQNKWIEPAKAYHGKTKSRAVLDSLRSSAEAVAQGRVLMPLSGIHYMETARISNPGRKARLGHVMWELSRGVTLASIHNIVVHECEVALSKFFQGVERHNFRLLGRGVKHAFGGKFDYECHPDIEELFERYLLTGVGPNGELAPGFRSEKHRRVFCEHLRRLPDLRNELPRDKWDDALYAIAMADIVKPLSEIMKKSDILFGDLGKLGIQRLRSLVDGMPSRSIDVHLHRQVLKNPRLMPKLTDLEDWAGLGVASQYCDLVVCESHFADLVKRDAFPTEARIETNISVLTDL